MESQVVALYHFDPSTIDWPYKKQKPLALQVGQIVTILYDDGSEWALGALASDPNQKGYYPKNYTVTLNEYYELMKEYEEKDVKEQDALPPPQMDVSEPPSTLPSDVTSEAVSASSVDEQLQTMDETWKDHPPLSAHPPIQTTFSATKSKLLRQMPTIPDTVEDEEGGVIDVMNRALNEAQQGVTRVVRPGMDGMVSDSRASTPATYSMARPDKDFVRKHMSVEQQDNFLSELSGMDALIDRNVCLKGSIETAPYHTDLRIRATTTRIAINIEPPHTRMALQKARAVGARWSQHFRPELNDIVNESLKMGCDACLLSNLYLYNLNAREQFQRLHAQDSHGTLHFELQRKKQHLFYMRMDGLDVMMIHPDAWGFPDANNIIQNPGEQFDPFHGWLTQTAINADREMEDVMFTYHVRVRSLPERTFQSIALGKMPEWIAPFSELRAEIKEVPLPEIEYGEDDGADIVNRGDEPAWAKPVPLGEKEMLAAGLAEEEDVYVKVDEIQMVKERTVGPDVLDLHTPSFKVAGVNALRLLLRSRGNPDGTKNLTISPKQVKDIACQLGISGNYHYYWYCMFALRFPLPREYDVVLRNDIRWYLHLPTDTIQPIHPLIDAFTEHLADCQANDFLWNYRGFVNMKCSECGLMDALLWCQQCTDYFCITCFNKFHQSTRGRKHWSSPIPGCRYLTKAEVREIGDRVPLLNVGFCNRRRFLARDNQSDKMGVCQCKWLYFHKDTFQSALSHTPEKHWQLKRLNPPRLAPEVDGYYYNFSHEVIGDDPSSILQKTQEQRCLLLVQKMVRGQIARKRIQRWTMAAIIVQKYKRMWDCQKFYGKSGSNALILRGWYRTFHARNQKTQMHSLVSRIQSLFRGKNVRIWQQDRHIAASRIQSLYRGSLCREQLTKIAKACDTIQRGYRMHLYGRRPMQQMHTEACRIQALLRGVLVRKQRKYAYDSMTKLQARVRGMLTRERQRRYHLAATTIQASWRRFQTELDFKLVLYGVLEKKYMERQLLMKQKLADLAALLIQRTFRRYQDHQLFIRLRREKVEADKRISTILVAFLMSGASCGKFVHPWMRHLPAEIQEVLEQIKASLQRSIALIPIRGKLANEDIGKKSVRTTAADLVLDMGDEAPDLASQMLLNICHHLLSHVPKDVIAHTMKWACYSLGHISASFLNTPCFSADEIELGSEVNPRPGDPLVTFWQDKAHIMHHHDRKMTVAPENLHLLFLKNIPSHLRHVFLTAQTLITARQALDLPSLGVDDHLAFQGLDATVGTQLQDVLSNELSHRLPPDWPRTYGTVHALATQTSKYITELAEEKPLDQKAQDSVERCFGGGKLAHFNRSSVLRSLQQMAFFMRNQDVLLTAICNKGEKVADKQESVRQSRFVSVLDKLFDIAYKAKHDHCPFVLSVVLFHMVQRAVLLRLVYHRAAITIQARYRYYHKQGRRLMLLGPTITIQRLWRGTKSALLMVKKDDAAAQIQRNFRAMKIRRQNRVLLQAALRMQRVFRGIISRRWVRRMHQSATLIQKMGRGMLVRVCLDREGRRIAAKFKQEGDALRAPTAETLLEQKAALIERMLPALHRHRERNVELRRMLGIHGTSKHGRMLRKNNMDLAKGSVQPIRISIYEPLAFAIARERQLPPRYEVEKTKIMALLDRAKRVLEADLPPTMGKKTINVVVRRGRMIMIQKRISKRPKNNLPAESLLDVDAMAKWENRQFRTSIMWLPKTVGLRLVDNAPEQGNLRATYLLSTAFIGAFVSRCDETGAPPWYHRVRLLPPTALASNLQSHMVQACRVICAKLMQDTTHEVKPQISEWQAGLLCARHVWRSVFAHCASKFATEETMSSLPVLWMSCSESIRTSLRQLLSLIWLETEKQFTTKESRYRGLKSRPPWETLQGVQYQVLAVQGGFNLGAYNNEKGHSKAASLSNFFEEVMALRFGIEWMSLCLEDGQEYMQTYLKRRQKSLAMQRMEKGAGGHSDSHVESLCMGVWTDDAEIRSITTGLIGRLLQAVEGCESHLQAVTVSCQLLLAVWKGAVHLFSDGALRAIDQIAPTHAIGSHLPIPSPKSHLDGVTTQGFHIVAYSYEQHDIQDVAKIVNSSPMVITRLVCQVQSRLRAYILRQHLGRMKIVAKYCQEMNWPRKDTIEDAEVKKKRVDEDVPANYKPQVSKYLGGPSKSRAVDDEMALGQPEREPESKETEDSELKAPAVEPELRITADHRACADFFAVFMVNMYRRREIAKMYRDISGAYDECLDTFNILLVKNPSLRPMVDSVGSQLKRGAVVGFDKAFKSGPVNTKDSPVVQKGKTRPQDSEMFRRQPQQVAVSKKKEARVVAPEPKVSEEKEDANISGDYLAQYLIEMDGDDSQFKDIDASVIPYSTGTSPRRERPDDFLRNLQVTKRPASGDSVSQYEVREAPAAIKIDAPWCLKKLAPLWLPIKAHRFTAYRGKILQILPQQVLAQYCDHEKAGQYPACIKLLESAIPGSLNVFSPTTVVGNKPLLIETVYQLLVGYVGLCLKNQQLGAASRLILEILSSMPIVLKSLHPAHRAVVEACLFDTALSVSFYATRDMTLQQRSESFFQEASTRYLHLKHTVRYSKCCVRYAAVLSEQQHHHEAEYFIQQALNQLVDAPSSSLLVVCYHNLAIKTMLQHRLPDATCHMRTYLSLLKQLPKLSNHWMQKMDNTQWLLLKLQEMWPAYQEDIMERQGIIG